MNIVNHLILMFTAGVCLAALVYISSSFFERVLNRRDVVGRISLPD